MDDAEPGRPPGPTAGERAPVREPVTTSTIRRRLARDEHAELVRELSAAPWQELQVLGIARLRAVTDLLGPALLDAEPLLLFALARVAEAAVELRWRTELLDRAMAAARAHGDTTLELAVIAERAGDAAIEGEVDAALEQSAQVLAVLSGTGDAIVRGTRGRAALARGRALAFRRDPADRPELARLLAEAAFLLGAAGEPELEVMALTILGYAVQFADGDVDAAIETLRAAATIVAVADGQAAATLTFLADALLYAGRLDEAAAALERAGAISRRLDDQRVRAYHAWMEAGLASRRGDLPAVQAWLTEVERHPGDWFGHPTGIEFLADAADHLGRLGHAEAASRYVVRVEERCRSDPRGDVQDIALSARAIHDGRFGDPVAADADLVALLASPQLPPRERWRITLLRAATAARRGDDEAARRFAREAAGAAAALGHPELPRLHEPWLVAQLEAIEPSLGRARASSDRPAVDAPGPRITILGGFAVSIGGRVAMPPPGRPAALVKLLALRDATVPVEEAIELLWPEIDEDVGRARLRNVLSRIRSACGDIVDRTEGGLRLSADAQVDATEFERAARDAISASRRNGPEAEPLVRQALARYTGELLPEDRYEAFAVAPRERLSELRLALLDRLSTAAAGRGDTDEALRALDEAIAAQPLDEHRYVTAADLALQLGRVHRAMAYVSRGLEVTTELGVEPSRELAELRRRINAR